MILYPSGGTGANPSCRHMYTGLNLA